MRLVIYAFSIFFALNFALMIAFTAQHPPTPREPRAELCAVGIIFALMAIATKDNK